MTVSCFIAVEIVSKLSHLYNFILRNLCVFVINLLGMSNDNTKYEHDIQPVNMLSVRLALRGSS